MVGINELYAPGILNIFTDASIVKYPDETIGCSGFIATTLDSSGNINDICTGTKINRFSTNNDSEIKAIEMGVNFAIMNKNNFRLINLFSDSKICIYGLREWIYNWTSTIRNGRLMSTSGEVMNQEAIKRIICSIINNKLQINMFHQNGHIDCKKSKDIEKASNTFLKSNDFELDEVSIITISAYNDLIDNFTRSMLTKECKELEPYKFPAEFGCNFDMRIYGELQRSAYEKWINTVK